MTLLSLYHWDYHRLADGFNPRYETCSIAIFQWQPRAAGKGLKQVNACRVCGYAADVDSVYTKAQEICDRLNSEQAEVSSRPAWLQKQYSVPRPASVPKREPRDGRVPRNRFFGKHARHNPPRGIWSIDDDDFYDELLAV